MVVHGAQAFGQSLDIVGPDGALVQAAGVDADGRQASQVAVLNVGRRRLHEHLELEVVL